MCNLLIQANIEQHFNALDWRLEKEEPFRKQKEIGEIGKKNNIVLFCWTGCRIPEVPGEEKESRGMRSIRKGMSEEEEDKGAMKEENSIH